MFHTIYNFFTVELSSYYLDVLKDRLYCSGSDSEPRRSGQTALFELLKTTLILMAPILPFTTEEAWGMLPESKDKYPAAGIVSWITPLNSTGHKKAGVGVEFTDDEGIALRYRIDGLLREQLEKGDPTYTL